MPDLDDRQIRFEERIGAVLAEYFPSRDYTEERADNRLIVRLPPTEGADFYFVLSVYYGYPELSAITETDSGPHEIWGTFWEVSGFDEKSFLESMELVHQDFESLLRYVLTHSTRVAQHRSGLFSYKFNLEGQSSWGGWGPLNDLTRFASRWGNDAPPRKDEVYFYVSPPRSPLR